MPLVICSKSTWQPAIRREHALALLAAAHGHHVDFIERPLDIRALRHRSGVGDWCSGLLGREISVKGQPQLRAVRRSTVLPGHLNDAGELTSNLFLRRALRATPQDAAIVVNVPWDWPAAASAGRRCVFDCADDWSALMKHRSARLGALYARIAEEADAVILASDSLVSQFPRSHSVVVSNGVSDEMLEPLSAPVTATRMVHVGTLTPRFDARLAAEVLDALPDWTLDLYGQCQYPGRGERPGPDLSMLLSQYAPRVSWHGVVPRESLAEAIDRAAVALVFNRAEESLGQDSMKIYDYAARGRPIVATRFSRQMEREGPPHVSFVEGAQGMAQAVQASSAEPASWSQERRRWAEEQRWSSRWEAWARAVFGEAG